MSRRGTVAKPLPKGGAAVMAQRREPPDSLDFFPTPPWATRALLEHVLCEEALAKASCWEPAAGAGHMSAVLGEVFAQVYASDVFDYGCGFALGAFAPDHVGLVDDRANCPFPPDWVITNPPFNQALAFLIRALSEARRGVALLVRLSWLETGDRYDKIFAEMPPSVVALFAERVPMVKGRWDPEASTATAYCWVIWEKSAIANQGTRLVWIPPGCREALTRSGDRQRFAPETMADLFTGGDEIEETGAHGRLPAGVSCAPTETTS